MQGPSQRPSKRLTVAESYSRPGGGAYGDVGRKARCTRSCRLSPRLDHQSQRGQAVPAVRGRLRASSSSIIAGAMDGVGGSSSPGMDSDSRRRFRPLHRARMTPSRRRGCRSKKARAQVVRGARSASITMATRSSALAGQASMRDALVAAIERSGRLDPLILAPRRPKRNRARYQAKRTESRCEPMGILLTRGHETKVLWPGARR